MRSQLTLDKAAVYTKKMTDRLRRRATELVTMFIRAFWSFRKALKWKCTSSLSNLETVLPEMFNFLLPNLKSWYYLLEVTYSKIYSVIPNNFVNSHVVNLWTAFNLIASRLGFQVKTDDEGPKQQNTRSTWSCNHQYLKTNNGKISSLGHLSINIISFGDIKGILLFLSNRKVQ